MKKTIIIDQLVLFKGWKGKSKSSHDLSNDPKLSTKPAVHASPGKHPRDSSDEVSATS